MNRRLLKNDMESEALVSGIGNEADQQAHALERILNCTRGPTEGRCIQGAMSTVSAT